MTYKTGQRFKAKIQGVPVEGRIYVDGEDAWLCQDHSTNEVCEGYLKCSDNLGYKYAWKFRNCEWTNNLKIWGVTDLELLPDVDEPQKGDLVEVSGDGNNWQNIVQWVYTGGQTKFGNHIVEYGNHIGQFKHIRLAASPEKLKREEAKQKAEKFMREHMPEMEGQSYGDHSKIMSAIALYILKEKM